LVDEASLNLSASLEVLHLADSLPLQVLLVLLSKELLHQSLLTVFVTLIKIHVWCVLVEVLIILFHYLIKIRRRMGKTVFLKLFNLKL
jgi:hypothetical protein